MTTPETSTNVRTEAGITTAATTVIRSDREAPKAIINAPQDIPAKLYQSVTTHFDQDIKAFLAKPFLLDQGTVGLATTGLVQSWDFPEDILANALYTEKLTGFLGMRGTIEVRLQTNATRFQQCRLLMLWIPQGQVLGVNPQIRFTNLMTVTQLPRVEIDVACDSECVFELPYVSPTMFYNLAGGQGPWGRLYLYVYSPLRVGSGSNTFGYALWVRFLPETLDLLIPTYNASPGVSKAHMRKVQFRKKGAAKMTKVSQSTAEEEAEQTDQKPVSSALHKVGKWLGYLGNIPVVSDFAKPASWVASGLGGLASALGYSKPANTAATARMQTAILAPWHANCDAMDNVWPLSLTSGYSLDPFPGYGGSNQEEMCFDYIVTKSAWFQTFTWQTSTASGVQLQTIAIDPDSFKIASLTDTTFAPWAFLARLFRYWRGDIRLTWKFVKTEWHQGRIVVTYWPGVSAGTMAQSEFCHREIIDISQGNEFSIVVPFVSELLWRPRGSDASPFWTGYVTVHVLTELTVPDTVSDTIDVLCEVSGMPGMQFAVPAASMLMPHIENPQEPPSEAHSGELHKPANPCAIVEDKPLGDSSSSNYDLDAARYCVGESCRSILSLLRRYTSFVMSNFYNSDTNTLNVVRPWTIGGATLDPVNLVPNWFLGDYFSLFAMCYAYRRGSVRLRANPRVALAAGSGTRFFYRVFTEAMVAPGPTATTMVAAENSPVVANLVASPGFDPTTYTEYQAGVVWSSISTDILSVQVPFYHHSPYVLNRPSISDVLFCPADIYEESTRLYLMGDYGDLTSNMRWARAVGEDFQFTYWLGVPPLLNDDDDDPYIPVAPTTTPTGVVLETKSETDNPDQNKLKQSVYVNSEHKHSGVPIKPQIPTKGLKPFPRMPYAPVERLVE